MTGESITERAALEGLRQRCLMELERGNRRKATDSEVIEILDRVEDSRLGLSWGLKVAADLKTRALFYCLAYWLILALKPASPWAPIAAGIAIDILNKEER